MFYPPLTYVLLAAFASLLLLITARSTMRMESRSKKGYSGYAIARYDLSNGSFKTTYETMYNFLKERVEQLDPPSKIMADRLIEKLAKLSKGKKEKISFSDLSDEYLSVLDQLQTGGEGLG